MWKIASSGGQMWEVVRLDDCRIKVPGDSQARPTVPKRGLELSWQPYTRLELV